MKICVIIIMLISMSGCVIVDHERHHREDRWHHENTDRGRHHWN
jgi:hypothetical protein